MPRIPLAEALIDADTRIDAAIGRRYDRDHQDKIRDHLTKHAFAQGWVTNRITLDRQARSRLLTELDPEHGEELSRELELIVAVLLSESAVVPDQPWIFRGPETF